MKNFEVIQYELFGLTLQEPMALIYNWLVAVLCFVWFLQIKPIDKFTQNWRSFFLIFAIATFCAGFAHSLYQYTGIYGKMPHWVGGIISGYFVGKAMLSLLETSSVKKLLNVLLYVKLIVNISLALLLETFTFVLIDSALTYIVYCAGISISLVRKGNSTFKLFVWGVVISFLGAISFILKLDISKYFNREDFSHIFVLASLILYYIAVNKVAAKNELVFDYN